MEIVRMVTRVTESVESFPTLDSFVTFVRSRAKIASQVEDTPDELISIEFVSDYESSNVDVKIKTPQTAEELAEQIEQQKRANERRLADQQARELKEYERLKAKFG